MRGSWAWGQRWKQLRGKRARGEETREGEEGEKEHGVMEQIQSKQDKYWQVAWGLAARRASLLLPSPVSQWSGAGVAELWILGLLY